MTVLHAARHASRGLFHALAELGAGRMAPPRDTRDAAHRLAGALGAVGRAHDLVTTVHGDVPRGVVLLVANHVSYLDPLALLPICPAIPVAKGEVAGWPIVGPIGHAFRVAFVDRRDAHARVAALRRMYDLLAAGTSVLNFPEGTTTRGDRVLPFWRGGFGVAQRLGVPIVPVAIRYADPALAWCDGATFVPHYLRTAALASVEVALAFGAPMHARTGESPESMAARARGAIALMLERIDDAGTRTAVPSPRPDPVLPPAAGGERGERGRRAHRRAA